MQTTVRQRIIFLREYLGDTQYAFAKRTGFTNPAFIKWEKEGAADPKPSSLRQISDATGCSFTWLKDGVGEMFTNEVATRAVASAPDRPKGSMLAQIQQLLIEINTKQEEVKQLLGKSLGNRYTSMLNA